MERASRYILDSKCGKKDKKLFMEVMKELAKIINKTKDVSVY